MAELYKNYPLFPGTSEIDQMYKKDYVSLYSEEKEIKFPNWLIREIGTIKSNIKWNGNKILISDKKLSLTFKWIKI